MKFLRLLILSLVLPSLVALAVPSDPVGVFKLRLRGNSDTIVSLPLLRPAVAEGALASRAGSDLTFAVDVPAIPATGAFVLVMSGALEGAVLPVTGVNGRTVSVTAGANDLGTLLPGADTLAIIPYWTLDTVFPGGTGVNVSTSALSRTSEVLLYKNNIAGTNRSAAGTYFYFAGNATKPAGWYQVGSASPKGGEPLDPFAYFIVRHNTATETALLLAGGVQMAGFRVPLAVITAGTNQDNFVALPIAQPVTLAASRLVASGAFTASTSALSRADELLVFNNSVIQQNKSASATYFYFAGNQSKPAGWYQVGVAAAADAFTLNPGEGFIIRKKSGPSAKIDLWDGLPVYLH